MRASRAFAAALMVVLCSQVAQASVATDFESYTSEADVQALFVVQPGNGNSNVLAGSNSITLGGVGTGNQYAHMTATVGAYTYQFRSNFDPTGDRGGILPAIADLSGSESISISAQILSRSTIRNGNPLVPGDIGYPQALPYIQIGFTPNKVSGGINRNTDVIYGELTNDGTQIDMNILPTSGTRIGLPTGFTTKVSIPGGFQSGGRLTLTIAHIPGEPSGNQSVTFTYTDPSNVTTTVGPFNVLFQVDMGQPWATGNTTIPFIGNVRGFSADGSGGVTHNDVVTTDFDNFSVTGPLVLTQQPSAVHVCPTGNATFTVAAQANCDDGSLNYQWQESTDGGMTFNNLSDGSGVSGSGGTTLTVPAASRDGHLYECIITSTCSSPSTITSYPALLTVDEVTPAISVTPSSGVVSLGGSATLLAGGLLGQYYNYIFVANTPPPLMIEGHPDVTSLDPVADFDYGTAAPFPGINPDRFEVRWQEKIVVPVTSTYTFYTRTDDGARLWIDGNLIIDRWVSQGATEWCGSTGTTSPGTCNTLSLTAGQVIDVKFNYFEGNNTASARLQWAAPDLGDGSKRDVSNPTVWKQNGAVIPNATSGRLDIASFGTMNAGSYTAEITNPCTGLTVVLGPVSLVVSADFDGNGTVDLTDVDLFIGCATGPGIPYGTLTLPCVPAMDQDGDGDIDQDDFGFVQTQYNPL